MRKVLGHHLTVVCGLAVCAGLLGLSGNTRGAAITLDSTTVSNAASQVIHINISGSEQITGSDLWVQIGNGGADNGGNNNNGGAVVPTITSIDMITGTIFASNNSGQSFFRSPDNLMAEDVINTTGTPATTVSDNGRLATLTLNASGVSPGTFTMQFFDVGHNDTSFGNGANSDVIVGGEPFALTGTGMGPAVTITVTPEPTSGLILLAGIGGLALRRSRRSI